MLPGIRSLAVAIHLEIYWVYKSRNRNLKYCLLLAFKLNAKMVIQITIFIDDFVFITPDPG